MTTENTKDIESTESDAVEAAVPTAEDIIAAFRALKELIDRYDQKAICSLAVQQDSSACVMHISNIGDMRDGERINTDDLAWLASSGYMKHALFVARDKSPEDIGKGVALLIERNNERSCDRSLLKLLTGK